MTPSCPRAFDEALISGFADGELTQAAEQRTRLHLEDCAQCRELLAEIRDMREATMSTEFVTPDDSQWDERPRGGGSWFLRGSGWLLALLWAAGVAAYGLWQFWTSAANLVERLLFFGGLSAAALLFFSVLLDRLAVAKSDRYREVRR